MLYAYERRRPCAPGASERKRTHPYLTLLVPATIVLPIDPTRSARPAIAHARHAPCTYTPRPPIMSGGDPSSARPLLSCRTSSTDIPRARPRPRAIPHTPILQSARVFVVFALCRCVPPTRPCLPPPLFFLHHTVYRTLNPPCDRPRQNQCTNTDTDPQRVLSTPHIPLSPPLSVYCSRAHRPPSVPSSSPLLARR
ncbi:hypothetical protein BD413DRAFT_280639 [Trametes elegans]|nr:hypothetical protein BD413DRAFT_280639 [Trametes elegans]